MQFTRLLRNESVTVAEMATCAGERTAPAAAGREVLAIQDSSELVFGGKKARARGFGPIGRGGATGGLLLHAMLAVDALTGGVLGAVDLQVRNRAGRRPKHRRARLTAQKESQRWLDGMTRAATVLAAAQRITVIADSESDIYEEYARRPANVHLITRVAQDRRLADSMGTSLLALADGLPEQARHTVTIPAAPGRPQRQAVLALRFAPVRIRKPKHGAGPDLPACVEMELVDIREVDAPAGVTAIHWRLLTTHRVDTPQAARMILDFYRRRWIIEDYFRTLKTAGFDIENCEIADPDAMTRFVGAAACAAVRVLQLVRARDGASAQAIPDAFEPGDQPILEAINATLEGKTQRQKNPHPRGSLAYAAWVIARLGAWDGYYGKPGPKVMRIGLQQFHAIRYGHQLRAHNV